MAKWYRMKSAPKNNSGEIYGPAILVWYKYDSTVRTVKWSFEVSGGTINTNGRWLCLASKEFLRVNSITHWSELPDLTL